MAARTLSLTVDGMVPGMAYYVWLEVVGRKLTEVFHAEFDGLLMLADKQLYAAFTETDGEAKRIVDCRRILFIGLRPLGEDSDATE